MAEAGSGPPVLSVIIPALNEAENLRSLLPALQETLAGLGVRSEVLVADGGSSDTTPAVARALGSSVVTQAVPGYGGALRAGFAAARGDYLLTMDGDWSHEPEVIRALWASRTGADLLIASRYIPGGRAEMGWVRWVFSRVLNVAYRRILDLPVRDLSSGFRLYRRQILAEIAPQATDFDVLQEILVKAVGSGFTVGEVPFRFRPRGAGRSHVRLLRFAAAYLRTLWRMWQLRNSVASADYDARAFDSRIPVQRYWQRHRYRIIHGFLEDRRSVLDIGCGSSRIISDLPEGVGLDVALRKLRYLKRYKGRRVQGSIQALPFREAAFRTVICSEVIEHVPPDPELFREMVRVLAPGGLLILGTPDYSRWIWRVIERVYGWVLPGAYAKEHITRYHAAGLRQLLQAMGCQLLEARYVGFSEWIAKSRKVGPCASRLAIPTWG
ncbi:MAG TPA: glycosyltransferase [Candidatus Methylomirabilis sp.]|jgi:glycosyltransferase involved in cell wall biosynthesis|nr:glycosyltransferase [Candidatus Methylomirabilis sp.]